MAPELPGRSIRRCPSCGSRLGPADRLCRICGEHVPWRLTLPGVAVESLLAVLLAIVAVGVLLWLGGRASPLRSPSEETAWRGVVAAPPTDMPTFTPPPSPTASLPPPTLVPPTETPLPATVTYVVVSGDTLYGIAAQFGVTKEAILSANVDSLEREDRLSIGQELRIPIARHAEAEGQPAEGEMAGAEGAPPEGDGALVEGPGPGEEQPPSEGDEPVPTSTAAPVVIAEEQTYVVRKGDTLDLIAQQHGTTVDELIRLNAGRVMDPATLAEGAVLVVQPAGIVTATPPTDLAAPTIAASAPRQGELAVAEDSATGPTLYPAPAPLAPADGARVTSETPFLRWSSAGVLPAGVYYVVAVRDTADPGAEPRLEWVLSNATAVRLPAELRPPPGSQRTLAWSVTVRRRASRGPEAERGLVLSPDGVWRTLRWQP
jgi:LysM repeat protein